MFQAASRPTGATCVQFVGNAKQVEDRAVIVAGSAGSLPFRAGLTDRTVVITGEMRHHDALSIARSGAAAILLGHWASERPALAPLGKRLAKALPGVDVRSSAQDCDPFAAA
jgi:putative NIF3 family GTP cyclohydrolase 1 type 2